MHSSRSFHGLLSVSKKTDAPFERSCVHMRLVFASTRIARTFLHPVAQQIGHMGGIPGRQVAGARFQFLAFFSGKPRPLGFVRSKWRGRFRRGFRAARLWSRRFPRTATENQQGYQKQQHTCENENQIRVHGPVSPTPNFASVNFAGFQLTPERSATALLYAF